MVQCGRIGDLIGARAYLDQIDDVGHATEPSDIALHGCSLESVRDGAGERDDTVLNLDPDVLVGDFQIPVEDLPCRSAISLTA